MENLSWWHIDSIQIGIIVILIAAVLFAVGGLFAALIAYMRYSNRSQRGEQLSNLPGIAKTEDWGKINLYPAGAAEELWKTPNNKGSTT